jgi:hypothetical protein
MFLLFNIGRCSFFCFSNVSSTNVSAFQGKVAVSFAFQMFLLQMFLFKVGAAVSFACSKVVSFVS